MEDCGLSLVSYLVEPNSLQAMSNFLVVLKAGIPAFDGEAISIESFNAIWSQILDIFSGVLLADTWVYGQIWADNPGREHPMMTNNLFCRFWRPSKPWSSLD